MTKVILHEFNKFEYNGKSRNILVTEEDEQTFGGYEIPDINGNLFLESILSNAAKIALDDEKLSSMEENIHKAFLSELRTQQFKRFRKDKVEKWNH